MGNLKKKYSKFRIMQYRVCAEPAHSKESTMSCDLCGSPVHEKIDKNTGEVMCHRCLMGLADAYDGSRSFTQEELVKAIRDREIEKFRIKYGLTQGFLSRCLGMSVRQLQRYEKGKYISIDKAVNAAQNMGPDVVSSAVVG